MRIKLLTIPLILLIPSLFAQRDTIIIPKTSKSKISKRVVKLCDELKIPYNVEADINLLKFTLEWRGTSYCFGGSTKKCIDCSGLTSNAYRTLYSKNIPRVSRDFYSNSMPIRKSALYQGDFVFFATAGGERVTHVGIYLWDGYFTHASSSKGVMISNLNHSYFRNTFVSGGAWID